MRWLVLVVLASCVTPEPAPLEPTQKAVMLLTHVMGHARPKDVLLVIDRSQAFATYAARMTEDLRWIARDLEGWEDVHLGVLSADPDDSPQVSFVTSHRDLFGVHTKNYDGALPDALVAMLPAQDRSAVGQPLAVIRRALEDPVNSAFRRPDAGLAIVIYSAADDSSSALPGAYARDVIAASQVGGLRVVVAAPGATPRFEAFGEKLQIWFAKVPPDTAEASQYVALFRPRHREDRQPCLERPLADPTACEVENDDGEVPACDATTSILPCWRFTNNNQFCGGWSEPAYLDVVRRDRESRDLTTIAQCESKR